MLKITRAHDPIEVKTITMCLYAVPGIGRTSTGFSAATPLLFDFDKAAYRSKNRRDTILIESWADVAQMTLEDLQPFKTVVIDTVGRALEMLAVEVIRQDVKNATRSGALSIQGYGALKTAFVGWMNTLRTAGLDVVLLAHMDEQRKGDEFVERLDIMGGSKNEVYKVSDAMGRLYWVDRKRVLNFNPSDVGFGKNPGKFDPIEVPDFATNPDFLGQVIAKTKAAINAMSAEQTEVAALQDAWVAQVAQAKVPGDFDALIGLGKALDERIRENAKRILVKAARDLEIVYDAKAGAFQGKEPAPAAQPPKASSAQPPSGEVTSASIPTTNTAPEAPPEPATPLEVAAKGKRAKKTESPAERVPGEEG